MKLFQLTQTNFYRFVVVSTLMLLFGSNQSYSQQTIDEVIAECDSLFRYGEYELVISKSQKELSSPTITQSQKIEFERILAFTYSVTGKTLDAQLHFANILNMNPDYTIDSIRISPKIYQVFREVESNYQKSGMKRETIPIAQIDSTLYFEYQRQTRLLNKTQQRNQSIKLGFFYPGVGMLTLGESTKGWFFIATETVLISSAILASIQFQDAKKMYQNERVVSKVEDRYQDYRNWKKTSDILWITTAITHLYGFSDILLRDTQIQVKTSFLDQRPTISITVPLKFVQNMHP